MGNPTLGSRNRQCTCRLAHQGGLRGLLVSDMSAVFADQIVMIKTIYLP
jgi:hypothetical protein